MGRRIGFRALGSVLTGALADLGLGSPVEASLHARWAEAVGPRWARATRLEKLEGGKVTIGAADSISHFELTMGQEALRLRLNAFLGTDIITEVHVKQRMPRGR